jgi:hypothetical protein
MSKDVFRRIIIPAICWGIMTFGPVHAEEYGATKDWEFSAAIYLWGAGIGGKTASGSEVDVSFDDLFDNLNSAFMGTFEARKDKWLVITDLIYMDLAADKKTEVTIPINVTGEADMDLTGKIFQLAGGYNLHADDRSRIDLIAGARYLDLDMDTSINITGPLQNRPIKISESGDVWDGIVGVKGQYALGQRWSIPYYVDVGTGQSEFTWQAMMGVGFNAAKWLDIALVYRHLAWEVDGDIIDNINFTGPALGAVFRF